MRKRPVMLSAIVGGSRESEGLVPIDESPKPQLFLAKLTVRRAPLKQGCQELCEPTPSLRIEGKRNARERPKIRAIGASSGDVEESEVIRSERVQEPGTQCIGARRPRGHDMRARDACWTHAE